MREIVIPFSGFYNSDWSEAMDQSDSQLIDYLCEEYPALPESVRLDELILKHTNYQAAMQQIAEKYVDAMQMFLKDECSIDITLTFNDIVSPREYNFTTDRLFAAISDEDCVRLYNAVDKTVLDEVCQQHLTSYDGFVSFYDPDHKTWRAVEFWDHNQLSMLLYAALKGTGFKNWLFDTYEIYRDCDEAMDMARDMVSMERELQLIIEGIPEDGRKYPHNMEHNVEQYVLAFDRLNHYAKEQI